MEQYTQIFLAQKDPKLRPGQSFELTFDYTPQAGKEHRLFFTGEVDNYHYWKTENCCPAPYKRIDESLVPGEEDAWALKFEESDFPRCVFKKMTFPLIWSDRRFGQTHCNYAISVRLNKDYMLAMFFNEYK